jgi:hypothetical protein
VAKVSSVINKEVEIIHPAAMMVRRDTAMAVTRSKVCGGDAELVVPSELVPKENVSRVGKKPYDSSESVPLEVTGVPTASRGRKQTS